MGWWRRRDPGPCIVCGAPHTTCVAPVSPPPPPADPPPTVHLGQSTAPGEPRFTTKTYRRPLKKEAK